MINLYNNKYAQKQKEFSSFVMDRLGSDDPVLTFDCLIKEVNLGTWVLRMIQILEDQHTIRSIC